MIVRSAKKDKKCEGNNVDLDVHIKEESTNTELFMEPGIVKRFGRGWGWALMLTHSDNKGWGSAKVRNLMTGGSLKGLKIC